MYPRWREAKTVCQQRCGGLSLNVIRELLVRWATQSHPRMARRRRSYFAPYRAEEPVYRVEPFRFEQREEWDEAPVRYVRVGPEYQDRWLRGGIDLDGDGQIDLEFDERIPADIL